MTPADELRQAAARLRELAANTTPGEWAGGEGHNSGGWIYAERLNYGERIGHMESHSDAEWIATMSPAVAEPLARWLEDAAGEAQDYGLVVMAPAYDLARQINAMAPCDRA